MCGFVGFTGDVENKEQVLTSMMDRIVHRGPDMGDTFFAPGVALASAACRFSTLRRRAPSP